MRWVPELSLELAVLLLALALLAAWRGVCRARDAKCPVRGLLVLVLGRYLDVTVPGADGAIHQSVLGQPASASDSRHVYGQRGRLAMAAGAVGAVGAVICPGRRAALAFSTTMATLARPVGRRGIGALALVLLMMYGVGRLSPRLPTEHWFALPVTGMLVEQAADTGRHGVQGSWSDRRSAATAGVGSGPLGRGDVFVIFSSPTGVGVRRSPFRRPARRRFCHFRALAGGFRLASGLGAGGIQHLWRIVLAGAFQPVVRVAHRDQGDYQDLLASDRATLASRLATVGYRTISVMPGLKYAWPEGQFYRFDRVYNAEGLRYPVPLTVGGSFPISTACTTFTRPRWRPLVIRRCWCFTRPSTAMRRSRRYRPIDRTGAF